MKLYHCKHSRSLRVIWAAEEMSVALEIEELPFPPRAHEPSYFEVNPTGTVPTLIDGEVKLHESNAIIQYLARKQSAVEMVVRPGRPGWTQHLDFLVMGEATLTPPLTTIVRYKMLEPPERRLPQAVEDAADVFHDRLQHVTKQLQGRDWLCGDRLTLADISVGYAVYLGDYLRQSDRYSPEVTGYLERIKARPAFQRALARN